MLRKVILILQIIFIVVVLLSTVYFSVTRPRILVVQSYDQGYSWTNDVAKGLARVLQQHPDVNVHYTYMDTKRKAQPAQIKRAAAAVQQLIDQFMPNVLLLVDDDAQQYVGKIYAQKPGMNVVFAGVNADISKYGYHDKGANVTGILERVPWLQVKKILCFFHEGVAPEDVEIFVIGDQSDPVLYDVETVRKFDWAPYKKLTVRLCKDFNDWKKAVHTINMKKNALVILTNYYQLKSNNRPGRFVQPQAVMTWTLENLHAPMVGTNSVSTKDGCPFAVGASPIEQGEVAAQKAIDIAYGRVRARDIPVGSTELFLVYINKPSLDRYRVHLPYIYTASAQQSGGYTATLPSYRDFEHLLH